MTAKRQFKGGAEPRTFFDRKVRHQGYSRSVSLGKVIPKDWQYVRIHIVQISKWAIDLQIQKLLGENKNEQKGNNNRPTENH